jgi:hypothetical protein
MVASAQRRGPRNRSTSILSFTQRDESGRGYIAQSIRNKSELFKNNYDDINEIGAMDILIMSIRSNIPFDKTIDLKRSITVFTMVRCWGLEYPALFEKSPTKTPK